MSLWVRNEKRLNMQCSKIISKDVRAVRSECATQKPRRAVRVTRHLFEILIWCLLRRRLERKSTKKTSNIHENEATIDEKSILGRFGRPRSFRGRVRTRSGRLLDAQLSPQGRSGDAPGGPRAARSAPRWPQDVPGTARTRLRSVPERSPSPIVTPNAIRDLL